MGGSRAAGKGAQPPRLAAVWTWQSQGEAVHPSRGIACAQSPGWQLHVNFFCSGHVGCFGSGACGRGGQGMYSKQCNGISLCRA
jgi:hypothetical protein